MSALPTAAALLATATLAINPAQSQMLPEVGDGRAATMSTSAVHRDVNDAHSRHEGRATAFAATAAQHGVTKVALGVVALRRSRNRQVRQLAQRMVQDHGRALQELQSLVERKGLVLPTQLNAKYEAMVGSLHRTPNAAFDKAYVELVGKDHAQIIAWFESASRSSDSDVAGFAHKTLATLREHKQLAEHLHAGIGMETLSAR